MSILVFPPKGLETIPDEWRDGLASGLGGQEVINASLKGALDPSLRRSPSHVLVMNHQPKALKVADELGIVRRHRILVALEPEVTQPNMYVRRSFMAYGQRFAPSVFWAQKLAADVIAWPQTLPARDHVPHQDQRQSLQVESVKPYRAALIAANKRSAVSGSLYGLRRRIPIQAQRVRLPIVVAGPGWSASRITQSWAATRSVTKATLAGARPNFREAYGSAPRIEQNGSVTFLGPVRTKEEVLRMADLAIVVENSSDYVSEKVFDCISAGSVPVYVGPTLSAFGVPDGIALSAPPVAEAIIELVASLGKSDIEMAREAGTAFLASAQVTDFSAARVWEYVGDCIRKRG